MLDISNIYEGEVFGHPLCLLRIIGLDPTKPLKIIHETTHSNNQSNEEIDDKFLNHFIMLSEGENKITLESNGVSIQRTIQYVPSTHDYSIRLVYVTCWDEEDFQGPPNMRKGINEAVHRIQVGSLLLQTFTAETLSHERLTRKTFQLERQADGYPKVFNLQLPLTMKQASELTEESLWKKVALEILSSSLSSPNCKYLAFCSWTRFSNPDKRVVDTEKDVLELTEGHISLGGGGLALVGTGGFYAWAPTIKEVLNYMRSEKKVDTNSLMDFSGGLGTWGATYGTHLGSVLHELAHTLDLGHTSEGIMQRGFEDFHLFFTKQQLCNDYMMKMTPQKSSGVTLINTRDPQYVPDFVESRPIAMRMVISSSTQPQIASSGLHSCEIPQTKRSPIFERLKSFACLNKAPKLVKPAPRMESGLRHFDKQFTCRAFWERPNAVLLAHHRWMTGLKDSDEPVLLKGSIVSSNNKIRLIEIRDTHMMYIHHWEFVGPEPPAIVHIPWNQVPSWPETLNIEVLILDDHGGILKTCIPKPEIEK